MHEQRPKKDDTLAEAWPSCAEGRCFERVRVRPGKTVQFIRVAHKIDGLKTHRREVEPLFSVAKKTGCGSPLLVTDHERETISQHGFTIEVMPAREWLLTVRRNKMRKMKFELAEDKT